MWNRLNAESKSHRENAATYLNMILDLFALFDGVHWRCSTVTTLALAPDPTLGTALKTSNEQANGSAQRLLERCNALGKKIELHCAGLVELVDSEIRFVHRSAQDFLVDTLDGRAILAYDKTSRRDRVYQLINAHLTVLSVQSEEYLDCFYHWLGRGHYPIRASIKLVLRAYDTLGTLSDAEAMELLDRIQKVTETTHWVSHCLSLRGNNFSGQLAQHGCLRFLLHTMNRAEEICGSTSSAYRSYLIFATLRRADKFNYHAIDTRYTQHRLEILCHLLSARNDRLLNRAVPNPYDRGVPQPNVTCRTTTMMEVFLEPQSFNLGKFLMDATPLDISQAFTQVVDICFQFINVGEDLTSVILFPFEHQNGFEWSYCPDWNTLLEPSRSPSAVLLVQLNMAFVVDMWCRMMSNYVFDATGRKGLDALWKMAQTVKKVDVLGAFNRSDPSKFHILAAGKTAEYTRAVESLPLAMQSSWTIGIDPTMDKSDDAVSEMHINELETELIQRGLLVRRRDVETDLSRFRHVEGVQGSVTIVSGKNRPAIRMGLHMLIHKLL